MKIYIYPADRWACGHYRLIWPAQAIARQFAGDVEIVIAAADTEGGQIEEGQRLGGRIGANGSVESVIVPDDADVIVLQRPSHKFLAHGIPRMREQGVTVVVDIDDDLSKIHPSNPAFAWLHPKAGDPDHSWQNVELACRHASLVTVSTPLLLEKYAKHGRGIVVENAVPERFLSTKPVLNTMSLGDDHGERVVTWCGSLHSHPDDLRLMGSAFAELERSGVAVGCVGNGDGVVRALGLPYGSLRVTGTVPFEQWPEHVAASWITTAPLADTHFNACKSWLKPLEAMALGVPVVMSPRPEYQRLHDATGVGLLADKPKHWSAALKRLVQNDQLRVEQSEAGVLAVGGGFTIERTAWRWLEAWQRAFDTERGTVPA